MNHFFVSSSSGKERYNLDRSFFVRDAKSDYVDPDDTVVVAKTSQTKPTPTEYVPEKVKGLSSACQETPEGGQYEDPKMPDPEIATNAVKGEKTHTLKGDNEDAPMEIKPNKEEQEDEEPGDQDVEGVDDFTDFMRNMATFMQKFAAGSLSQGGKKATPGVKKRKSNDDLPKYAARQRLSKNLKVKTIPITKQKPGKYDDFSFDWKSLHKVFSMFF